VKVLVTGANGFLGRHVVAALRARGHQVRALVRPAARLEALGWPAEVQVVRADLRTARDLEPAFYGVDVLVHLAAAMSGGDEAQFAGTVVGTERLLAAMAATTCRRVVLASSFSVYDWSAIRNTLDERSPVEPPPELYERDGYSIAKSWQERVTRRLARRHGWGLTVLRPGFIWGRDHAYVSALGIRVGRFHVVIGPRSRCPLTHVENCADLFALAAADPRAVGETFNVVDGEGERIWGFLGAYLRGSGERGTRIPVPYALAFGLVRLAYATVFAGSSKLPQILVPCRFESRLKPLRYTNRHAREILGWRPPLDLAECLARTFGGPGPAAPGGPGRPSRPAGGDELSVETLQAGRGRAPGIALHGEAARGEAQAGAQVAFVEQADHGGGEAGRVVRDEDVAAGDGVDALRAEAGGDDGPAHGHGLDDLEARASADAERNHDGRRRREVRAQVVDQAHHLDGRRGEGADGGVGVGADDPAARARARGQDARPDLADEEPDPVDVGDGGEQAEEDDRTAVGGRIGGSGLEEVHVRGVGDDGGARGGDLGEHALPVGGAARVDPIRGAEGGAFLAAQLAPVQGAIGPASGAPMASDLAREVVGDLVRVERQHGSRRAGRRLSEAQVAEVGKLEVDHVEAPVEEQAIE
jgi:UDP-glucose 4-epimerase